MTDSTNEDLVTQLNTQLNKSMVLMENVMDSPMQSHKHNKSIKINTIAQPPSASNSPAVKSRRSILKKSNKLLDEKIIKSEDIQTNGIEKSNGAISQRLSPSASVPSRPRNLQELIQKEILDVESVSFESFNLDDLSDNEEIWIMEIPKSINPQELHGQTINLGDKSRIKIKEERYCTVTHNMKCNVTCVFNTGEETPQYKIVNIKPAGSLTVRRKLSGALKMEPIFSRNSSMPLFPDNLKIRHPLFGVTYEGKLRRKTRKRSSVKKKLKI